MSKSWTTRRRGDEKDFLRWLAKGKTVYVINRPQHAGAAHLWNHAQTWSEHTCTGQHPLLGGWQIGNNVSAKSFFRWHGEVYAAPPRGIPHHSDPGPDCRDEGYGLPRGWEDEVRRLDLDEVRHMEKRAREAGDQYDEDRKAGRRGGRWF
ncbi:hypothetical protein ACWGHD_04480 [Streptomyces xanthophaeus]